MRKTVAVTRRKTMELFLRPIRMWMKRNREGRRRECMK